MKWSKAGPLLGGLVGVVTVTVLVMSWGGAGQAPAEDPASTPLPRSMKGYELYSWPADGSGWRHLLVTGTNRLKTGGEILSATEEVSEGGLVILPVQGTEALIAALGPLPEGETVNWIGPGWLAAAGGAEGPIALPGPAERAEVAAFCRARGVELRVTE